MGVVNWMSTGALPVDEHGRTGSVDFSKMPDEEAVALAQAGDEEAVDYLLHKYQKLVYIWTRPYFLQGAEDDDLLQEGMIGLYKAIRDFSPGSRRFGPSPSSASPATSSAPSKGRLAKSTSRSIRTHRCTSPSTTPKGIGP